MNKIGYVLLGALISSLLCAGYYFYTVGNPKKSPIKTTEQKIITKHPSPLSEIIYSPMGDSISTGLITEKEEQRFTSVLAAMIAKKQHVKVIEKGVHKPGATLNNLGLLSMDEIIQQKPNLVTIEYGTNDILAHKDEQSLKQFEVNLSYAINELQKQDILLVLVTTWNRDQKISKLYDDIIIAVGQKYQVPVANIRNLWIERDDTINPKSIPNHFNKTSGLENDMHPNEKGHQLIAERIYDAISVELNDYLKTTSSSSTSSESSTATYQ
ncbi:SGNH/GDSL hydrolase family protein [Candidatus Enterococcus mansonii]|uniref:SGNH hydrolase-type esterase domain-containing protein n=1 Tax=Candidatus Enterococcus mansonii TaxID=1834181 RepID=A0A242C6W6_9ENTE|nr:SGNH/GDSL hydrolase family protein [Enterococcus sp. 4G2_DIV0659]OTO05848.1 hypothetical protein A5880_003023 [Enterococcus sp. 4G2_DIV0659]